MSIKMKPSIAVSGGFLNKNKHKNKKTKKQFSNLKHKHKSSRFNFGKKHTIK
jgi:hypothetical protein